MEQMLAKASKGVSSTCCSPVSGAGWASGVAASKWAFFFFVILSLFIQWSVFSSQLSVVSYQTVPAVRAVLRVLKTDALFNCFLMHHMEDALPSGKAGEPG
jgi:hypothetical protein